VRRTATQVNRGPWTGRALPDPTPGRQHPMSGCYWATRAAGTGLTCFAIMITGAIGESLLRYTVRSFKVN